MTTWERMINKSLKNFQEEQKNTQAEAIKNRSGNRKLIVKKVFFLICFEF